jgi:hypothetical protein
VKPRRLRASDTVLPHHHALDVASQLGLVTFGYANWSDADTALQLKPAQPNADGWRWPQGHGVWTSDGARQLTARAATARSLLTRHECGHDGTPSDPITPSAPPRDLAGASIGARQHDSTNR